MFPADIESLIKKVPCTVHRIERGVHPVFTDPKIPAPFMSSRGGRPFHDPHRPVPHRPFRIDPSVSPLFSSSSLVPSRPSAPSYSTGRPKLVYFICVFSFSFSVVAVRSALYYVTSRHPSPCTRLTTFLRALVEFLGRNFN